MYLHNESWGESNLIYLTSDECFSDKRSGPAENDNILIACDGNQALQTAVCMFLDCTWRFRFDAQEAVWVSCTYSPGHLSLGMLHNESFDVLVLFSLQKAPTGPQVQLQTIR